MGPGGTAGPEGDTAAMEGALRTYGTVRVGLEGAGAGPAESAGAGWTARILSIDPSALWITLPYSGGRVALMRAGASVTITLPGKDGAPGRQFVGTVRERRLKPVPSVIVGLPGGIRDVLTQALRGTRRARVIAVASGKGGVGKSVVATGLGLALAQQGYRTLVFDADLGTANVDTLLGLRPAKTLADLVAGRAAAADVVTRGPGGVGVVAGASGMVDLANLSEWQFGRLLSALGELEEQAEFMIVDTGAGVGHAVTNFFLAADDVLVVTSPEPTALVDAYALVKAGVSGGRKSDYWLVVNRARDEADARAAAQRVAASARRFLEVPVTYAGWLPDDSAVPAAVRRQLPVALAYPRSAAARAVQRLADRLTALPAGGPDSAGRPAAGAAGEAGERAVPETEAVPPPSFAQRLRRLFRAG